MKARNARCSSIAGALLASALLLGGCYSTHGGADASAPPPVDAAPPPPDAQRLVRCPSGGFCEQGQRCCPSSGVTPVCVGPAEMCPGEVPCGRGGSCQVGEVCCVQPADGISCLPAGSSCPETCFDEGECGAGATCVRNQCGAVGECQPLDRTCPAECPGVCACGGQRTYCNGCEAANAGADGWEEGSCSSDPELGLCQRVCARAKPVCGLTLDGCDRTCADDLADCSEAARREVERCANLDECGVVIECLQAIACIDVL